MQKLKQKNISLQDLFEEVRALCREISMFTPKESIKECAYPRRIVASYKKAVLKLLPM